MNELGLCLMQEFRGEILERFLLRGKSVQGHMGGNVNVK
jgi:hypothetical protein